MGQIPHRVPFIHWYAIEMIQSNPAVFNIQLPIAHTHLVVQMLTF